jgi:amidase
MSARLSLFVQSPSFCNRGGESMNRIVCLVALGLMLAGTGWGQSQLDLTSATIADLNAAFKAGTLSTEKLVELYLSRIHAYDKEGPKINSVVAQNPKIVAEAKALDAERKAGKLRGPLHGIPFSLKDNINAAGLPTTAGSCLLAGSMPSADAFVVKKLRDAGAILVSKDNLSEFAAGGGSTAGSTDPAINKAGAVPQGLSSIIGQTRNPHGLTRGPAGSSGGTGAGIASGFAQFGLGSDTRGSVRNPAAANGVVGLRPTLGLLSRTGLVPLALSLDTVGPLARNVYDIAAVLGVLAGVDPADNMTKQSAGKSQTDYTKFLKMGALKGARIGIARDYFGDDPETLRIMNEAIATMQRLGAVIVDPVRFTQYAEAMQNPMYQLIQNAEFKAQIDEYLKGLKPGYPRSLDELVAKAMEPNSCYMNTSPEKAFALKYTAALALDIKDPAYLSAVKEGLAIQKAVIQTVFKKHQLDAIIYPTTSGQSPVFEPENAAAGRAAIPAAEAALQKALAAGSLEAQPGRPGNATLLLAVFSGFPDLVVPAGMTKDGMPITLSFMGEAFAEPKILSYGYDFEQATRARKLPKNTPALPGEALGQSN